jgi:hypothetical protein
VDKLDELMELRVKEGELPDNISKYLARWLEVEGLFKDYGGDRTKIIAIFLIYLALPKNDRYSFITGYIEKRIQDLENEKALMEIEQGFRLKEISYRL